MTVNSVRPLFIQNMLMQFQWVYYDWNDFYAFVATFIHHIRDLLDKNASFSIIMYIFRSPQ